MKPERVEAKPSTSSPKNYWLWRFIGFLISLLLVSFGWMVLVNAGYTHMTRSGAITRTDGYEAHLMAITAFLCAFASITKLLKDYQVKPIGHYVAACLILLPPLVYYGRYALTHYFG